MLFSPLLERALRTAAVWHVAQRRKGSQVPYVTHPAALALILQRAGFDDEHILAAAILHDVIEDTPCSLAELARDFPPEVVAIVTAMSERKTDEAGAVRPWHIRKEEHLAEFAHAPLAVRAVALADKLHNLSTIAYDLDAGLLDWRIFTRPDRILWYYGSVVEATGHGDPRLEQLAAECREVLARLTPHLPAASGALDDVP